MNPEDVNTTTESQVVEDTNVEAVSEPQPEAGSKTDPTLLLKSLHEEKEKRRELEAQLAALQAQPQPTGDYSDEGLILKKEIDSLKESIAMKELKEKFPELKDKAGEFDDFRKDYPNVPLENVAKLFRVEKGLIQSELQRPGLEKSSGGGRSIPPSGMTADDVTKLRTTNFPKYLKLVQEGKIKL